MGLFDIFNNFKRKTVNTVKASVSPKSTFTFSELPKNVAELSALPEAALDDPYKTAALTVLALNVYATDRANGKEMLNFLKGPRPLTGIDISFLNDRFMDGKTYIPRSFFAGATPANDYTPSKPYTLTVSSNQYSDANQGYKKLFLQSGGADSLRAVVLRLAADGKWYLWEQELLAGIRVPNSQNVWA